MFMKAGESYSCLFFFVFLSVGCHKLPETFISAELLSHLHVNEKQ